MAPAPPVGKLVLQPNFGAARGGERLAITAPGLRFAGTVQVLLGDRPATVEGTLEAGRVLLVQTPPGPEGQTVDLVVILNPGRRDERRLQRSAAYRYLPTPTVHAVRPRYAAVEGGTVIQVQGAGFPDPGVVQLDAAVDGVPVWEIRRIGPGELRVTLPEQEAGRHTLELILRNKTGRRRYSLGRLNYLLPLRAQRLALVYRWIDLRTRRLLSAGLIQVQTEYDRRTRPVLLQLLETLTQQATEQIATPQLDRDADRIWLVRWNGYPWLRPDPPPQAKDPQAILIRNGLAQALRGRGLTVDQTERNSEWLDEETAGGLIFGTLPIRPLPGQNRTKLLLYRVVDFSEVDLREPFLSVTDAPAETSPSKPGERFAELQTLAAGLSLPTDRATILVRLDDRPEGVPWRAEELMLEEALLAGLVRVGTVQVKLRGPVAKPPWIASVALGYPNPLAYVSWGQFRRENGQAEAVLFYRPEGPGVYYRWVDGYTGRIRASGRLLPARALMEGSLESSPYEQALSLAEAYDWSAALPETARIVVLALPTDTDSGERYHEALLTALLEQDRVVLEPLSPVYDPSTPTEQPAPPPAKRWLELRALGATHILEHTPRPDDWTFRLFEIDGTLRHTGTLTNGTSEPVSQACRIAATP